MTRNYRVKAVTERPRLTHYDFIRPSRDATLTRVEDGRVLHLILTAGEGWEAGDVVEIDDSEVRGVFARDEGG